MPFLRHPRPENPSAGSLEHLEFFPWPERARRKHRNHASHGRRGSSLAGAPPVLSGKPPWFRPLSCHKTSRCLSTRCSQAGSLPARLQETVFEVCLSCDSFLFRRSPFCPFTLISTLSGETPKKYFSDFSGCYLPARWGNYPLHRSAERGLAQSV